MPDVRPLAVPSGPDALGVSEALEAAVSGRGPLLVPHAPGEEPNALPERSDLDGVVAVGTSGSTGTPKRAVLSAAALRASAGVGTVQNLAVLRVAPASKGLSLSRS